MGLQTIKTPAVPCVIPITGVKLASSIHLSGIAFIGKNQSLCIELFAGNDLALCMYAQFDPEKTEMTLNSCIDGIWQNQERVVNPFVIGKPFKMKIKNKSQCLKIKINGKRFRSYSHKLPASMISSIGVRGDVKLASISSNLCRLWASQPAQQGTSQSAQLVNYDGPPPMYDESKSLAPLNLPPK
uniref:Galectin n=1 Tax=Acrobeloides nanus TaxID=290746 RepID=A0A914CNB6_9BILA